MLHSAHDHRDVRHRVTNPRAPADGAGRGLVRIVIDHDNCRHADAFATQCLAETILDPLSHQRYCMAEVDDDSRPELTVVLLFEGRAHTLVLHDQTERETVAAIGWQAFLEPETAGVTSA
jgi:hypothetical protein